MKIGIIETGKPSSTLLAKFGNYPSMFEKLIGRNLSQAEFFTVSVVSGQQLPDPEFADAWLITGSRHAAYDDYDWIGALETFVNGCFETGVSLIGVCFGHQIIAKARGGIVEKSNKGWGIGPQKYYFSNNTGWLDDFPQEYTSHAVHQDQVITTPPNTTVIASSDFCQYAALIYGNPDNPQAITVQSHPELSAEFVGELGKERLAKIVPEDVLKTGLANLGVAVNNAEWGKVFAAYFRLNSQ